MREVPGAEAREVAIKCVQRIEESESYANIIVPKILEDTSLGNLDRNLVTEIVYGSTRMKRALEEYIIMGINTNIQMHQKIIMTEEFKTGKYDINFMSTFN